MSTLRQLIKARKRDEKDSATNSDLKASRHFGHQAYIDRYRKMLGSYLTPQERDFVERRLTEEIAALEILAAPRSAVVGGQGGDLV